MKEISFILSFFLIFCLLLFASLKGIDKNIINTMSSINEQKSYTVVLDAGHGGEDGGAIAKDGTLEKDLNLDISKKIALFFEIFGVKYIEIRDSDVSVGDNSLDTIRKRKNSDILKRYSIVNSTENAILLSIHQNFYPIEKYKGTQVFYAPNSEASKNIALSIQNEIVSSVQKWNNRKIKESNNNIYLLYNAKKPSVLVECGFISNEEELNCLKKGKYQYELAYHIFAGIIKQNVC